MINCLLVGPPQQGGEGVYVKEVFENPPEDVRYSLSQEFHSSSDRARCNVGQEILLNQFVHPFLRYGFGFRALTVNGEIDLVHVHSHPALIHSKRRVPVVMSAGSSHYINVRDYEKWSERKIRRRYKLASAIYRPFGIHDELLNSAGVARIYTFSNWARQIYIKHGIPQNKVDVIPPGFDAPRVGHRNREVESVNFLFVGRDFVRKGGPLVVQVFERLRETNKQISLTVVTGDSGGVRQSNGIRVLPFMDREKLYREVYPAADVFVMPTEAEGWGFTNAEAMSFSLPVVSTNIAAIPEIVQHGVTGFLIKPRDIEELTKVMRRLSQSRDLREEMGSNGRKRFVKNFSRDVFREGLKEFYLAALRN